MPDICLKDAIAVGEQARLAIARLNIPHSHSPVTDHVTVSVGAASVIPAVTHTPQQLFEAADQALYQAKQNVRNQVKAQAL